MTKRKSIIAMLSIVAVLATAGIAGAATGAIKIKGGGEGNAMLRCGGGMSRLAHPFDEGFTTVFPGDPEVMVEIVNTIPVDFFLLEKITTGTHGGTHLDAPRHFIEDGRSIDQLDASEFVWPAYVIDVRERIASEGPDFLLTIGDIEEYEDEIGKINPGSMVIVQTGLEELFGTPAYLTTNAPGFSAPAVQWLFDERDIGGLGADGLGPDASIDFDFLATYTALDNDGVTLPGLNNLDSLNRRGDIIIAPAVPLVGGSGYQVDPLACHGKKK
ncbi:MAG: cyclase family protein [Acidimicrobiales bacterium]